VFLAWALLVGCTYGGLFTILAASSFVYMDVLGLSPTAYGGVMALGSLCYLGGTFVCRRWIARSAWPAPCAGAAGSRWPAGCWWRAGAAGVHARWAVLVPQCLFLVGHGIHQPCGQAGVVGPFPAPCRGGLGAGRAAAGADRLCMGRWLGVAMDGSVRPMAYGLAFWA
jgi:DHA1 family bicyclomycin/chloramphenicol resistance-like MFS transporter